MRKILVLMVLCAALGFSQAVTTATMDGTVTDSQGGIVVNVQVTVTNVNNGQTFTATTDEHGHWQLPAMQAGEYKVTMSIKGFRSETVNGVKMNAGTPATINGKLEVGQVTESVEVVGGAELVQTTNATVNTTLEGRQVFELPAITRGGLDLLVSQAGVQTAGTNRNSSINGLPNGAINVTLDGLSTQDQNLKSSNGFFTFIPITQDSIQEVTMTTSAAGADASGEGAAQIKFVTKSGTNQFHGGAFWQVRNTALDANSYFNNINGLPRNIIKLNQGGVHVGGPILKNKVFFFTNFEKRWLPQSAAFSRTVLNSDALNGLYDYADSKGVMHQANVLNLAKAAGYNSTLDPTIAKTLGQITQYSSAGRVTSLSPNGNYYENSSSYQVPGTDHRQYSTSRVDYNLNSKNQISLTYSYNVYNSVPDVLNGIVPVYPGTGVVLGQPSSAAGQTSNRFAGTLALRSTITSHITNDLHGGLDSGTTLYGSGLGNDAYYAQWKGFVPSFPLGMSGVSSYAAESRRNSPVKQVSDTLSYQKGQHMLSAGGNFTQVNLWNQSIGNSILPTISFGIDGQQLDPIHNGSATDAFTTSTMPGVAAQGDLDNAANLYALLTGRVSAIGGSVNQSETTHTYSHAPHVDRNQQREFGLFGQDSWRVLPNLTVTLGLRFEWQGPLTDLTGNYTNVDLASIWGISGIGNMFMPGTLTGVHPTYTPLKTPYQAPKMWSPSVGFAWQVPSSTGLLGALFGHHDGATVIRGGYAINTVRYGTFIMQAMYGSNPGNNLDASIDPDNYPQYFGQPGSVLFSGTLPALRPTPNAPAYPFSPNPTDSLNAFDPNLKMAYVQSWNFGIQREFAKNNVIEVRYTGNHGVKEWRQVNLNEVNVFENGFAKEFDAAYNNLLIARGGNILATNSNNFGNSGLPGQVNIPIMQTALGTACCNNSTYATYFRRNEPYAMVAQIFTNASRMANLTKAGYPANMFVVNPDVASGGTYLVTNGGASYYDALQAEFRRRISNGLTFQGSYVFGKSLINGPSADDYIYSEPTTFRNVGLNKMPVSYDIRHAFKINFIYELPFGPGRRFLSSGSRFVKKALEGWEITGIERTQSGTPAQVTSGRVGMNSNDTGVVMQNITTAQLQSEMSVYKTTLSTGLGAVYFLPQDLIGNSNAAWEANSKNWTNLSYNTPYIGPQLAPDKFGYRIYLYGPWQNHFDVSLIKRTAITEKANVEFRAQALDVLNLTNFYLGTVAPNSGSFGRTTSAYSDISNAQDTGARILEFVVRVNF
jgi:Carboxypeptidase regulatory-like domain